jgi:DNA topoisomerase-1
MNSQRAGKQGWCAMSGWCGARSPAAGFGRQRRGRGFRYVGPRGAPVTDAATLSRIKALVIPPAWEDVWVCLDPDGHIQAVGTDAAGRRQYRYHDR